MEELLLSKTATNHEPRFALAGVFRAFFDRSFDAMYVSTTDGRFLHVNKAMSLLLGYEEAELLRLKVEQTYALPGERRRFRHEIESNGRVHNFRLELLRKDGSRVVGHVDAVMWLGRDGDTGGYVGTIREEGRVIHVASEVNVYSLAIRGSNDGLWNWDLVRDTISFSPRFKAILGYSDYEMKDSVREWINRIHPEDLEKFKQALALYLQGKSGNFTTYYRMLHRSGGYVWVLSRGIAEFDERHKAVRLAGSLGNISSHVSVIENLKRMESRLSEENARLVAERSLLSRYFSEEVTQEVLSRGTDFAKARKTVAVVLCLRIRGCEKLEEHLPAERFSEFINEIVTDVMDIAYGHNGSVNRILVDTLLVAFGTAVASNEEISGAVECARQLQGYLATYNDVRPPFLAEPVGFSIGLSYGEVFSGTIGSVRRLDYAVYGRPVKVAARLAEFGEQARLPILVDEGLYRAAGGRISVRPLAATLSPPADLPKVYSLVLSG